MMDTTVFVFLSRVYIHVETADICLTMLTYLPYFLPEEGEEGGEEEDLHHQRREKSSHVRAE